MLRFPTFALFATSDMAGAIVTLNIARRLTGFGLTGNR
jgi:hypothetical protein